MIDLTKMTEKERKKYEYNEYKNKLKKGINALFLILLISFLSYFLLFIYLNPILYFEKVISLIFFIPVWIIIFKIIDMLYS